VAHSAAAAAPMASPPNHLEVLSAILRAAREYGRIDGTGDSSSFSAELSLQHVLRAYEEVLPTFGLQPSDDSHYYNRLVRWSLEAGSYSSWRALLSADEAAMQTPVPARTPGRALAAAPSPPSPSAAVDGLAAMALRHAEVQHGLTGVRRAIGARLVGADASPAASSSSTARQEAMRLIQSLSEELGLTIKTDATELDPPPRSTPASDSHRAAPSPNNLPTPWVRSRLTGAGTCGPLAEARAGAATTEGAHVAAALGAAFATAASLGFSSGGASVGAPSSCVGSAPSFGYASAVGSSLGCAPSSGDGPSVGDFGDGWAAQLDLEQWRVRKSGATEAEERRKSVAAEVAAEGWAAGDGVAEASAAEVCTPGWSGIPRV